MSTYAVVNPATGETIKEYQEISDDELRAAIGRADEASRTFPASTTVAERAALVRKVGELHSERREELAEIIVREMGKPIEQALMEVDFAGMIYGFYADNAESLMADEPIELMGGEGTAVVRRSPFGVAARDHALELPLLPGGPLRRPEPGDRQHDPAQARAAVPGIGRGDAADLRRRRRPRGRLRERLRDQRADRVGDRRPARARRLGHRLRARRRRRRRDRRPQPEEGRARARRLRSLHPARHRRPRRGRHGGGRSAARQHRPVLQRGQALHRRRRALRRLPREVQGSSWAGRSRATRRPRTPRSARSPRRPRPTGSRTR